jgi:hypothetical protein
LLAALTGWGQEEDKRLAREAGFDCHFTKPVDPNTLADLIAGKEDVSEMPRSATGVNTGAD